MKRFPGFIRHFRILVWQTHFTFDAILHAKSILFEINELSWNFSWWYLHYVLNWDMHTISNCNKHFVSVLWELNVMHLNLFKLESTFLLILRNWWNKLRYILFYVDSSLEMCRVSFLEYFAWTKIIFTCAKRKIPTKRMNTELKQTVNTWATWKYNTIHTINVKLYNAVLYYGSACLDAITSMKCEMILVVHVDKRMKKFCFAHCFGTVSNRC